MSIAPLSSGCLLDIMAGVEIDKPVLQILGSKRIQSSENSERYRLLVSDGKYLNSFAMLATQLNDYVLDGRLVDNTIVRVTRYITSMVNKSEPGQTKRVLIILDLEVLNSGGDVGHKVGNPVVLSEGAQKAPKTEPPSVAAKENNSSYNNKTGNSSMNQSTTSASISGQLTHPISSLSPYQNKWVIKARVTFKSPMRTWNNAKGEGKLFSMDLMDETGEIRATAFKEQADKFFDQVQVDAVYLISKCQLKPANKQFTTLKNDYEMTFTNETVMQECMDAEAAIPAVQYDFKKISDLSGLETGAIIDVIAVCKDVGDIFKFTAKTSGKELTKRDVTLVDRSGMSVSLTLWGNDAENFDGFNNPVVLVKNAKVNEFNGGKTVSMGMGCVMKINPDIKEGHDLRGWFDNGGSDVVTSNMSARTGTGGNMSADWLDFMDVKARGLGNSDKPDYYQCKATINFVKSSTNSFYKACPTPDCNKKVVEDNMTYRCEKCNAEFPNFKYRLLINISIADWSSNTWITLFSDHAEQLLEKTSQEVGEALEHTPELGDKYLSSITFKSFIFKMRAKVEVYGDSARTKTAAVSIAPINYKQYNAYLIGNLQRLTGVGKSEQKH